jgi:catechol 2,3-dioxygenase-like lactoylglutathione lyase family enzyme
MIRITMTSVFVDDQRKALDFYTNTLGFEKKLDIPLGDASWLTVVSPADPDGTQLLLEPTDNPIGSTYQRAAYDAGIQATMFGTDDLRSEYERLTGLGVRFSIEPTDTGGVMTAVFDDTCGNLIGLHQV